MMASWNVGLTALRVGAVPLLGRLVAAVGQRGARRRAARRARFLQGGLQGLEIGGWRSSASAVAFFLENRARLGKSGGAEWKGMEWICEEGEPGVGDVRVVLVLHRFGGFLDSEAILCVRCLQGLSNLWPTRPRGRQCFYRSVQTSHPEVQT